MSSQFLCMVVAVLTGIFVVVSIRYSIARTSDPVNPVAMVGMFFFAMYFGKFIYLSYGTDLIFSYNYKWPFDINYLLLGYVYCFAGFVLFSVGFLYKARSIARTGSSVVSSARRKVRIGMEVLVLCFFISASTLVALFGTMGFDEVLASLNNRFDLFAGRGYFFVGLSLYKVAFFLWVASLDSKPSRRLLLLLVTPAVLFDLATGSRGKVFFENILPLLYLLNRKGFVSLNLKRIFVFGLFVVLAALVYRSLVRDAVYEFNADKTGVEIILENIQDVGGGFYAGPEAPYLDTVVLLMQNEKDFLFGSSLAAVLTYPIPRLFYEDKPRGASAVLTEKYFPEYFYPYNIEISFPLIAEGFANFSYFGIVLLLFAGVVCAKAYNLIGRRSSWVTLICVFVVVRFVLLFRNDFFNNVTALFSLAIIALVLYRVASSLGFSRGRKAY